MPNARSQHQSCNHIRRGFIESIQARSASTQRLILRGCAMTKAMRLHVSTFLALAVLLASGASAQQQRAHVLPKVEKVNVNTPVTLTDNGESWALDNGIE